MGELKFTCKEQKAIILEALARGKTRSNFLPTHNDAARAVDYLLTREKLKMTYI